jgi:hypothetical protein
MTDFNSVRAKIGGLKGVMRVLRDAPEHDHGWQNLPECPFCKNKGCSGVFTRHGTDFFKCFYTDCSSGNGALTEMGYIKMRLGLSDVKPAEGGASPAYRRLLEMAGCWEEPKPKVEQDMTAAAGVVAALPPAEPASAPLDPTPKAVASAGSGVAAPPSAEGAPVENDLEELIKLATSVIRNERKATMTLLQRKLHLGYSRAVGIMDELQRRGLVGPSKGTTNREILMGLPPISPLPESAAPGVSTEAAPDKGGAGSIPIAERNINIAAKENGAIEREVAPGLAALRWFFDRLTPATCEMVPYLESGEPVTSPISRSVFARLKWRPEALLIKRAQTPETTAALGFMANPSSNEGLLRQMPDLFSWPELRESGLWLEADPTRKVGRRPNPQFMGVGQIGKKAPADRKKNKDKWWWGPSEPILIPYFNEYGDLVKLRPHKGGAPAGTANGRDRLYVPRNYRHCMDELEQFDRVMICEGEFKGAAVWQVRGAGLQWQSTDGFKSKLPTLGVCTFPGITYGRNPEMRGDLEILLKMVKCGEVIVAFDSEDKSDQPLHKRHGSRIYAEYLAADLQQKLHLHTRVCLLPERWRDEKGKSDFDGALVKLHKEYVRDGSQL